MNIFNIINSKGVKLIVAVFLIVYVAVTVYSQSGTIRESKRILDNYNENIEKQEEIAREIEAEKAQIGTDEYIEKVAREKLGMCKEDEKIFVDGKDN
ncbi:MAG: septum formation initiator family protein [Clostridia bacterium]|nr:septum formation initiator family protein [Clostridia bacterium]